MRGVRGREDRARPLCGRQIPWPTSLGVEGVHEDRDREPGHGGNHCSAPTSNVVMDVWIRSDVRSCARRHCDEMPDPLLYLMRNRGNSVPAARTGLYTS